MAPVLEKITQQTFRASEIVNGLLNFSRTGGSEFGSVDLNRLLLDTLTLVDHQFKTAQIRVETELDRELPRIQGNEGKLQQVVLNLLLNARDAMHGSADGRIRIATQQRAGRVTVVVQDFGGGIEPEHLHRIFDPFFTTKAKPRHGTAQGHRAGPGGELRHHAGARRQDAGGERAGRGNDLPAGVSGGGRGQDGCEAGGRGRPRRLRRARMRPLVSRGVRYLCRSDVSR